MKLRAMLAYARDAIVAGFARRTHAEARDSSPSLKLPPRKLPKRRVREVKR